MTTAPDDQAARLRAALVELTPAQAVAVEAIATGSTHAEAAEAAGVARETVTRWSNHHPGFQVALDRHRHAFAADAAGAALRIRGKALASIERHLDAHPDDYNAALKAVRAVPALELARPEHADERLAAELARRAAHVPSPPRWRDADGRIMPDDGYVDLILGRDTGAEHREQAWAIATEQLADAAGVSEAIVEQHAGVA